LVALIEHPLSLWNGFADLNAQGKMISFTSLMRGTVSIQEMNINDTLKHP